MRDPPKPPFNMIITGMTCCGKTRYLLEMLECDFHGTFDFIVIVCPTLEYNKTYQEWEYITDPDVVQVQCDHGAVDGVLKGVVGMFELSKTLIVVDDCACTTDVKNRTSMLVNLGFSGRHIGISTIVITQQLTSISKPYRENVTRVVAFYTSNRTDMGSIVDNYMYGKDESEIKALIKRMRNTKYSCLEISLTAPYTISLSEP